jgi:hypothetical protein
VTFEIAIDHRSRTVSVERTAAGRFRVIVDGRPHDVDAVRAGVFGLSLLLDGHPASSREIQIAPSGDGGSGQLLIGIDGRTVAATVNARRKRRAGAHGADSWRPATRSSRGRVLSSSKP